MSGYKPKTFDHAASHPRPELRPRATAPQPLQHPLPPQGFAPLDNQPPHQPAHPQEAQTWDPKPAKHHTPQQAIAASGMPGMGGGMGGNKGVHEEQAEGFTPANELLSAMGLQPLQTPKATNPDTSSVAGGYVEPHATDVAEFSPPRPTRRAPTVFAHLKNTDTD